MSIELFKAVCYWRTF